jgi:hypothetical protein
MPKSRLSVKPWNYYLGQLAVFQTQRPSRALREFHIVRG